MAKWNIPRVYVTYMEQVLARQDAQATTKYEFLIAMKRFIESHAPGVLTVEINDCEDLLESFREMLPSLKAMLVFLSRAGSSDWVRFPSHLPYLNVDCDPEIRYYSEQFIVNLQAEFHQVILFLEEKEGLDRMLTNPRRSARLLNQRRRDGT